MCIIAIKPKGISIPVDRLKHCWDSNPDGAGFMYSENDRLNVIKGLMTFESFLEAYDKINPIDKSIVIHFRFGTHGDVCPNLTHPFIINKDLALVHNGIFTINLDDPYDLENKVNPQDIEEYIKIQDVKNEFSITDEGYDVLENYEPMILDQDEAVEKCDTSDTLEFCNILKTLPKNFLSKKAIYFLLNSYVERESSVVVFMDNKGNINIVGANNHIAEDGVWYSNHDYKGEDKRIMRKSISTGFHTGFGDFEDSTELEEKGLDNENCQKNNHSEEAKKRFDS